MSLPRTLAPNADGTFGATQTGSGTQWALATKDGENLTYRHFDTYPDRETALAEYERRYALNRELGTGWDPTLIEVHTTTTTTAAAITHDLPEIPR